MPTTKLETLASLYFTDASVARLKSIARLLIHRERPGHTLQATSLVNECFLKMRRIDYKFVHDEHFFRSAARAMRQVLVDHARVRKHKKSLTVSGFADALRSRNFGGTSRDNRFQFIWKDLQKLDPQMAETLWLRYVEELTQMEIAEIQNRPCWRVRNDLEYGGKWLKDSY